MDIRKKRWFQTGIALFCSVAVGLSTLPSFADGDVGSLEDQTSALENELANINQDILSLNDEISTAEMQIEILEGEIGRTSDALDQAVEDEEQQYEDMKTRIKYMYENGSASLLEMLFSAESMADFLNKADFIEHLSEYDRNALEELKTVHQDIENQKTALEEQQDSLVELQAELQTKKSELQAKADETSTNLEEVKARLEEARAEEIRRQQAQETVSSGSGSTVSTGSINASADDITLLAAILECEAIYDYEAMLAVATVIMNRVASPLFPNTIRGVIYAKGQFEPVWTGRLDAALNRGPSSIARQAATDAVNGKRLAAVSNCYYFLYAPYTNRDGVNIGNNLFFERW